MCKINSSSTTNVNLNKKLIGILFGILNRKINYFMELFHIYYKKSNVSVLTQSIRSLFLVRLKSPNIFWWPQHSIDCKSHKIQSQTEPPLYPFNIPFIAYQTEATAPNIYFTAFKTEPLHNTPLIASQAGAPQRN